MKGYVLNLERRPERLRRFMGWNAGNGLDLQVVAGIDGLRVDRADMVRQGLLDGDNKAYTPGSLGGSLSHRRQWQECVAEGVPRMVFEDDACLRGDIAARVAALADSQVLDNCDIVFLGHNGDAPLTMMMPDGLLSAVYFGVNRDGRADFYDGFRKPDPRRPPPALHAAVMVWGCIAYVVTPRGAERLLQTCFPLSSRGTVRVHSEGRDVRVNGIDGMMNQGLQGGQLRGFVFFPPLAISPNDLSDVSPRPSQG